MPLGEAEEMLGAGPGERVDGLGRVADHADVVALPHPQVEQPLLERVDVLVLVDDEVAVLLAHRAGDVVALAEDPHRHEQDVLEVDDPAVGLDLLVGLEQPGHAGGVDAWGLAARGGRRRGIRMIG